MIIKFLFPLTVGNTTQALATHYNFISFYPGFLWALPFVYAFLLVQLIIAYSHFSIKYSSTYQQGSRGMIHVGFCMKFGINVRKPNNQLI